MNFFNDRFHLIGMENYFYLFELESTGQLMYKVFNNKMDLIDRHSISNQLISFNLGLDDSNRIILTCLEKGGALNLLIYDDSAWTKSQILSLDTKSNKYHQFELFYLKESINIIYAYSNLINSEIINLEHIIIHKDNIERKKIIRYIQKKGYNPFSLGFDEKSTIHLVYNTTTNFESYVYYSFYNPYKGSWSNNPKELSTRSRDNNNPYLLMDSKSNLHTVWLEIENERYVIKHWKMPILGKDKYIWKNNDIAIPFKNLFTPIVFEKNGELILLCPGDDFLLSFNSKDYGDKWYGGDKVDISNSKTFIGFTKAKNIHPQLIIKDVLVRNSKINDLRDLYLDLVLDNTYEENIVDTKQKARLDDKPIDLMKTSPENQNLDRAQIDLDNIERTVNLILENQKLILEELNLLKTSRANNKSSFIDRLFKGN